MNTKSRLFQLIDNQYKSHRKFYSACGLPNGAFTTVKTISSDALEKIFYIHPDWNFDWVVTGRGEKIFNSANKDYVSEPGTTYGVNYKEKYFETLEKYNNCLEEKEQLKNKQQTA